MPQNVLTLSREVDECEPLRAGSCADAAASRAASAGAFASWIPPPSMQVSEPATRWR